LGRDPWRRLHPVLKELGGDVSIERELPCIETAYRHHPLGSDDAHARHLTLAL